MKIFDLDSPLMNVLNKMADLMWLNILTLICCIPVITAGAALTSMHYVALKIVRNEESYITRSFFKSFKTNSTICRSRNVRLSTRRSASSFETLHCRLFMSHSTCFSTS